MRLSHFSTNKWSALMTQETNNFEMIAHTDRFFIGDVIANSDEDPSDSTFNFRFRDQLFRLRGGNPSEFLGKPLTTVVGQISTEKAQSRHGNLPILDVIFILSEELDDRKREENIADYCRGPYVGRLLRPDVFGECPDLMTDELSPEQLQRMQEGGSI
jgi:hypothetical protein